MRIRSSSPHFGRVPASPRRRQNMCLHRWNSDSTRLDRSIRVLSTYSGQVARALALLVACALLTAGVTAAQDACPATRCFIDLETGFVAPGCQSKQLAISTSPTDASSNGYLEAVFEVDIDGGGALGCSCLNVVVEFDGPADGWALNVCDSPGNNGYGGDAGQTDFEAELQLLNGELRVYGAYFAEEDPYGTVERIWTQKTSAGSGALRFQVCDQRVSWGNPEGHLESGQVLKRLFYVPDPNASGDADLFVGLNRVCASSADRNTGTVRRAVLTFE